MNTITAEQAADRVEGHVRAFVAALPGARLEVSRPSHIDPCNQPLDGGSLGRVFAGATWWVRDVPPERNAEVFDLALRFWAESRWTVLNDFRPQRQSVYAEAPDPDFTGIALKESVDGSRTLSISSSSPCVWPDGSPPP